MTASDGTRMTYREAVKQAIREALANAQLEPHRIGYIEAHGTGTALGDPIEVEALAATVGTAVPGAARKDLNSGLSVAKCWLPKEIDPCP